MSGRLNLKDLTADFDKRGKAAIEELREAVHGKGNPNA